MKEKLTRCFSAFLAVAMLLTAGSVTSFAEPEIETDNGDVLKISEKHFEKNDYRSYKNSKEDCYPKKEYIINATDYSSAVPIDGFKEVGCYQGKENAVLCEMSSKSVEYKVDIEESGFYKISLDFFPIRTEVSRQEISVSINGNFPFKQTESLYLNYEYKPENDKPLINDMGDQYAPRRIVNQAWTECVLVNPDNDTDGPLEFWLDKGENTIKIGIMPKSSFVLGNLSVLPVEKLMSYKEYIGNHKQSAENKEITTEAEKAVLQSDSTIIPVCEQSDPLCSPKSVKQLKINTIGASWSQHGQWMQWDIDVKETGYYKLSVRYKQNGLKGLNVKRTLYIDGKVPFKEAEMLSFPYTSHWQVKTLGDDKGNDYLFYLEKGKRKIRFEAVLGELADIINDIDQIVYDMNNAYRSVVMITSTTADKFRDYHITKELPELLPKIKDCSERLEKCNKKVEKLANGSSADSAILVTTSAQLKSMLEDPETIPYRLSSWESNIGSISSWAVNIRQQPLQMDYFIFSGKGCKLLKAKANFFEKLSHSFKRFAVSFASDYSDMNNKKDNDGITLTVWLGTGRDQAEVLWQMTDDLFTPETGIKVRVKLVSATMIEAFLSGRAPDISVQVARDIPVNLAVRGALIDLSSFEEFDTVREWFTDDAFVPYTFQNCVYGLPDSQSFNMMFYRTDVFEELGLDVPQTWDEFVNVANQLHLKQLDTGVPVDLDTSMYYTLLLQNNGKVFNKDYSSTLLDTQVSIDAFTQWTKFFTESGLPISYNLFNRFRSGEMPLVIAPYTNYNQIVSAAPEIRNLWNMVEIPGTMDKDGNIIRSESATGTAAVMLSSTKHPKEAWQFLKWWVGDNAQIRYAQDIESRIGTLGRVASANTKALSMLEFSGSMGEDLLNQRNNVREIAQVPGNYYLERDLLNAYRDVIYNDRNAKESILDYSTRINSEIQRKRKELGIG